MIKAKDARFSEKDIEVAGVRDGRGRDIAVVLADGFSFGQLGFHSLIPQLLAGGGIETEHVSDEIPGASDPGGEEKFAAHDDRSGGSHAFQGCFPENVLRIAPCGRQGSSGGGAGTVGTAELRPILGLQGGANEPAG